MVRSFTSNGSRDLFDLTLSRCQYLDNNDSFNTTQIEDVLGIRTKYGMIDMHDQEPIDIDTFHHCAKKNISAESFRNVFSIQDFVFSYSSSPYMPIICHSELHSNAIKKFADNFFIPIHFWSHGLTSRYWFTQYELLKKDKHSNSRRFGTYIRAKSGSRTYRKTIIEFLKEKNISVFCNALDSNSHKFNSDSSASIEWGDHSKFDIQIVAETLFDTEKTHLTEKACKPIVMYQPFILFSGPRSLEYLKSYGFKTFGDIWDESYDSIDDATERSAAIFKLISKINSMSRSEYTKMIEKTESITAFNRNHFFSTSFYKQIITELTVGLDDALLIQEDSFYTMPGGTLFYYFDLYYDKFNRHQLENEIKPLLRRALINIKSKSINVANIIGNKYNKLL